MIHDTYMLHALQLAEQGRNTVSPNPMVGCVIVKNKQIIGQGFHQQAGHAHAEVYALQEAGLAAKGATAYVTLEPCCHLGLTPACTTALIKAGLRTIYVACLDPNPLVAGKGIEALRAAGIDVKVGLCAEAAKQLNEIFFHYILSRRPFVIAKWAMSLDGKTITHPEDSRDISCAQSQAAAHEIRQQVDAILIGAKTAINDNPLLTVRLNRPTVKQPIRIILSHHEKLPVDLHLFTSSMAARTIVVTTAVVDKKWQQAMQEKNVEFLVIDQGPDGQINLKTLLLELGKRKISSVLIEGGMTTHERFFQENLVNKIHVYLAPLIIGTLPKKKLVKNVNLTQMDRDYFFTADYEGNENV